MTVNTYPNVLIISDATWSNNNNIGNTYSNLFGDWPEEKISIIYTRGDLPENDVCTQYFQISENRLIKNIFDRKIKTGQKLTGNFSGDIDVKLLKDQESGKKMYDFFKSFRLNIFLNARNLLWKFSNWKSKELDDFLENVNPDVIFLLGSPETYLNNLQRYVIKKTDREAAIYFVDDIYSMKRFSLSPFFWINKLKARINIRKTIKLCNLMYTIVPKQKNEYEKNFHIKSKLLNKGAKFEKQFPLKEVLSTPLEMVFTGNIYAGRWETLSEIGSVLDGLNKNHLTAVLKIYSQNKLDNKMKKAFDSHKSIKFMGGVHVSEIKEIQKKADILVHVESLKLNEKLLTRLSFSTKLVDYFERGRCIFAVGWDESASMEYLKYNDAAVTASSISEMKYKLKDLLTSPDRIKEYSDKSYKCGYENHKITNIRENILQDLIRISEK
ncbi:hypothetical protein [Planococcus beigongshangi]|uniref:hypothetical protein n=1 Tax=Planococcus beigongshangi TaxID=2782536 RepID=UPI00193B5E2A|nr:hypothetical protein [Planococcus beigongshangi]